MPNASFNRDQAGAIFDRIRKYSSADEVEMLVSRDYLALGAHDTNQGLVQLFLYHTEGVEETAVGGSLKPLGHLVAIHYVGTSSGCDL